MRVVKDWQLTREARTYLNGLYKRKKRVQFGLLEHPAIISPLLRKSPVHTSKIFLYGKAGIGKTSTVMKLAGLPVPQSHQETLGIQTTNIYWPLKMREDSPVVDLLQVELWDTGERTMRKFEHILPTCLSSTNSIAFFFSYNDRSSWDELPDIITQAIATGKINSHLKIVIATKTDTSEHKVKQEEVDQFEKSYHIKIIPISNVKLLNSDSSLDGQRELSDICTPLNTLSELILNHEKEQLLQHSIKKLVLNDDIEISDV